MQLLKLISFAALTAAAPTMLDDWYRAASAPPKPGDENIPVPWTKVNQSNPPPHNKYYGKVSNLWAKVYYQYPSKNPGPNQISCDPDPNLKDPNAPKLGSDWIQLTYGYPWQVDPKLPRDQGIAAIAIFADPKNRQDQNAVGVGLVTGPQYMGFGDGFMKDETDGHGKCGEACGNYLGGTKLENDGPGLANMCPGVYYVNSKDMVRAFDIFRDEWVVPKLSMGGKGNPPQGYQLPRWNDRDTADNYR